MTPSPLIAIVDDDGAIRNGLSSLLRSEGYGVELFASAEAFLDRSAPNALDCLITDIQMPGLTGLELQAILRKDRPSMPVIIMTAFPEPTYRERATANGAICFLSKPFNADELLNCVGRAVRQPR
ncbi:response regulator transcription factor [Sphingomonas crocodyli]|uniref:Response regulator n=1 Tax=Sphingomonas crocodyli TaxID=1979270 RepID=A0A437M039_9SPHN|nr:response regulator [Sphingomonas crocodyli]RVT90945.1 response regulator [Sphingomonas crocodyli]